MQSAEKTAANLLAVVEVDMQRYEIHHPLRDPHLR